MKSPIDTLLDQVEFEELKGVVPSAEPYATHFGILKIDRLELRVFQLNTGKRIILEEDLVKFFGCSVGEFWESLGLNT